MLRRLDAMDYDLLLVTPTLDINNPESPQWPGLFIDRGAACFAVETSKISQEPPSPKKHEADAAAEEETLNTHGKLLLETEDIKKPESPELPAGRSVPQAPKMQRVRNTLSGKNGSIDVFINLETTTIDSSDGPKLRAHIGTVLGKKYHSRFMTVYAIRTPDETLVKSLYQGKKIVLKPISKEKSSATSVNSVKVSVIMH
uniref:Uncharacterized protein n=1 Tax=Brassica campestris TaxID=3711 RepID=M4EJ57_BRACM